MLKMIKYNLKKRTLLILITTIVVLAIGFAMFIGNDFLREYYIYTDQSYNQGHEVIGPDTSPIMFITVIACILCTIIPVIEFSFKMSKVNIDQMYSLPIKRDKLYIAKFISGFIEILIPVLSCYIFCLLKILSTDHMYNLIHLLPYLGCLLFFMFILYATIVFFFTRGNTVVDGIMNILFIIFLFAILIEVMDDVFRLPYPYRDTFIGTYFDSGLSFLYSPIVFVTNIFNNKLSFEALTEIFKDGVNRSPGRIILETPEIVSIIMFSLIGIVSSILLIKLNKEDKAENSMQVSNSWFSYKTMIPIYFSMICLVMCENSELVGFIFLFVGTYVAYVIYRRTLKIKKRDIIVIGICFVSMIIIYILYENYKSGLPLIKEFTPPVSNIIQLLN